MLFVGDDWAEEHHDVEIVDDGGRRWRRSDYLKAWRHRSAARSDRAVHA